ncbi:MULTISPECIES: HNH endonuclease [unclassified Sphingobium]|uniref:HNH endonuclease n=1 Tax=unclassified Sphingobium TaxID=2611147 RepID=UPI002224B9A5|nr:MULTISPECIES: HNH endonuclease [unclassified Sphingobium]MCW2395410.1 putative restriction endonuclease [Sphingobium sp. B8D3B]MCW2418925.1 putative restriction endonuclease [Sphingobium sp. B8D3C]
MPGAKEQAKVTRSWSEAVAEAVKRHVAATGSSTFTRQELMDSQLDAIVSDTGSAGATPQQTLSRELQHLRDLRLLDFLGYGIYRWLGSEHGPERGGTHKGVFVIGSHSIYQDEPDRFYRFPTRWLANASKIEGNWIIYQEPRRAGPRGYYAVAKFEKIAADPVNEGMYLALIEPGSYLEFGRDVPFQLDGAAVERGLLDPDGRLNNGRAIQSIRSISDEDFNRIIGLGLIEEDQFLPRVDDVGLPNVMKEEILPWHGPIDRATMLVNRTVRDRQFRKRILDVYDCRCALTGMKLINGGGRAEAQAAHIMSVEAGGPDVVNNGIALSGTIHWMFDRGLISLDDDGEILLSRKINDIDGVSKLIHADRKARFPASLTHRPHPRYLDWHRRERFSA